MTNEIINNKTNTLILLFSMFLLCIVLLIIYNIPNDIEKCTEINKMRDVEKTFKKSYPIGNDFFTIVHSPKYSSFFDQFVKNDYYICSNDKKIKGTCCISELKNNLKYICDLKTIVKNKNLTFNFLFKYYYDTITNMEFKNIRYQMFGIVMQPNKIIDKIANKYWITKSDNLLLYQITYQKYLDNVDLINDIFGNHFFVNGYKNLILESTQLPLKICHLATKNDLKYVTQLQQPIVLQQEYEIMFCIPITSPYVDKLKQRDVFSSSTMSIFTVFNYKKINWNFIRTYMI